MPCWKESSMGKYASANKWDTRTAVSSCQVEVVLMCQILVEVFSVSFPYRLRMFLYCSQQRCSAYSKELWLWYRANQGSNSQISIYNLYNIKSCSNVSVIQLCHLSTQKNTHPMSSHLCCLNTVLMLRGFPMLCTVYKIGIVSPSSGCIVKIQCDHPRKKIDVRHRGFA